MDNLVYSKKKGEREMQVLIVEDDRENRDGLATLIGRIAPQTQVLCAEDAQRALELLRDAPVRLMFLDIRLPGMSGLELLEIMRSRGMDTPVVILSAYDYFPYAQQAIRLGVVDYLVKPYPEQSIRRALEQACAGLSEEEPYMLSNLVRWMQDPPLYAPLIAQMLRLPEGAALPGRLYLLCDPSGEARRLTERLERSGAIRTLRGCMRMALPEECVFAMFEYEGQLLAAVPERQGARLSEAFWQETLRRLEDECGAALCCAESRPVGDLLRQVQEAYASCRSLMEYAFYLDGRGFLSEAGLSCDPGRRPEKALLDELGGAILRGDVQAVAQRVEALRQNVAAPPYMRPQRLRYALHLKLHMLLGSPQLGLSEEKQAQMDERIQRLTQSGGQLRGFFEELTRLCRELAEQVSGVQSNHGAAVIQSCLEYIEKNYGDPELTQEAMARTFFFSSGYFGCMFKSCTGESFVPYLNSLRIEKAKQMLETTNLRVYEIASRTGFADVRYFIRVFNKHVKMSPNRYRVLSAAKGSDR